MRRGSYAWTWLRRAAADWWEQMRKEGIALTVIVGVIGAALSFIDKRGGPWTWLLMRLPNHWHTRVRSDVSFTDVVQPVIGPVVLVVVGFFLWNVVCAPYRLAKRNALRISTSTDPNLNPNWQAMLEAVKDDGGGAEFVASWTTAEGETLQLTKNSASPVVSGSSPRSA